MTLLRNIAVSYIEKYGLLLVNFGSSLILARLLSPNETGVFSVGAFVISLAHTVRDLGVSSYIVQEKELSRERLRSAQFVTLSMSWIMAGSLAALSGPLSSYYSEPKVQEIMLVLVINFLFLPFGSVTAALLKRDLEFGKLSVINIVSSIVQAITSVGLAYHDYGAMSLAWGSVAGTLTSTGMSMLFRRPGQPWLPGINALSRVFDKGAKYNGASIFYDLGQGAPELISAKVLSFHDAGLLSRGIGAVMLVHRLFVEAVAPVMVSHFASLLRNDPTRFRATYLASCRNITTLTWPAFCCLALVSTDVIRVLYGEAWVGAAILASILCISTAVGGLSGIAGSVIVGAGEAGLSLKLQGIFQSLRIILSLIGSRYGIVGVALGMAAADLMGSLAVVVILGRKYEVDSGAMIRVLSKPALTAVVVTLVTFLLNDCLSNSNAIYRLSVIAVAVTGVWLILLPILNFTLWKILKESVSEVAIKLMVMLKIAKK